MGLQQPILEKRKAQRLSPCGGVGTSVPKNPVLKYMNIKKNIQSCLIRKYKQFQVNGAKVTISRENYAQTLTDSTMDFSITAEEIRGGQGEIAPYVA